MIWTKQKVRRHIFWVCTILEYALYVLLARDVIAEAFTCIDVCACLKCTHINWWLSQHCMWYFLATDIFYTVLLNFSNSDDISSKRKEIEEESLIQHAYITIANLGQNVTTNQRIVFFSARRIVEDNFKNIYKLKTRFEHKEYCSWKWSLISKLDHFLFGRRLSIMD